MALEYNGQRIGAMQYNGVTIGEAMYNGQIVYRSSPYPAAGTFEVVNGEVFGSYDIFEHVFEEPGSYIITITVESGQSSIWAWYLNGVVQSGSLTRTYYGVSVGDTLRAATMHTAALNISGTWSIVKLPSLTFTFAGQYDGDETIHQHTVEEGGTYTLHMKALVTYYATHGTGLRVDRNGSYLADTSWAETDNTWIEKTSTVVLSQGDVLRLYSPGFGGTFANGTITLTKG